MTTKIGIDVGGTFTDFFVAEAGREPRIHKVLSTPRDPSIAVMTGLEEIAASRQPAMALAEYVRTIDTIVHGTTVTTNATLTHTGAKCGLITTAGVRDGDIVMTMGAGSISGVPARLAELSELDQ